MCLAPVLLEQNLRKKLLKPLNKIKFVSTLITMRMVSLKTKHKH